MPPLYDHECRDCELIWAEDYSATDEPPEECPVCKSENVYRHVGSSGFTLKGSGWTPKGR